MKKVVAIFEIPDGDTIDNTSIPKISLCCKTSTGSNLCYSTPVLKIIDDSILVEKIIIENNILF